MQTRATPRLYKIGGGREAWLPRRNLQKTLLLTLSGRSLGHTDHVGGASSPATSGGATVDPHSVSTSGAKLVGRRMAARDTDNKHVLSLFI